MVEIFYRCFVTTNEVGREMMAHRIYNSGPAHAVRWVTNLPSRVSAYVQDYLKRLIVAP